MDLSQKGHSYTEVSRCVSGDVHESAMVPEMESSIKAEQYLQWHK
jgi:hypothetical protein